MSPKPHAQPASMFFRMLLRAAMLRKGRAASALTALIVAAAAATAMLNLFLDVETKLREEFRKFGANIVVEASPGQSFSAETLRSVDAVVAGRGLAVPFAYTTARSVKDQLLVVAGTDFDRAGKMNPWWAVSAWPTRSGQALVGIRAAQILGSDSFTLRSQGQPITLSPAGTLRTGAGEDSRVYISLTDFRSWTGLDPSVVEVAAYGSPQEVVSVLNTLKQTVPGADVRPVRRVTEGEANVLGKTRSTLLASSALIVFSAALCVLATLMGWVFDRRRDFAVMKALGGSDRLIALFVGGEAAILGSVGAILGFSAGCGIAAWIGRANFHAPVSPRLSAFPAILIGCLLVTLISTVLPLRLLGKIQPAMILRGE